MLKKYGFYFYVAGIIAAMIMLATCLGKLLNDISLSHENDLQKLCEPSDYLTEIKNSKNHFIICINDNRLITIKMNKE